ncbi:unnamed protein product, partial [Mesorhabditis spiculigera]
MMAPPPIIVKTEPPPQQQQIPVNQTIKTEPQHDPDATPPMRNGMGEEEREERDQREERKGEPAETIGEQPAEEEEEETEDPFDKPPRAPHPQSPPREEEEEEQQLQQSSISDEQPKPSPSSTTAVCPEEPERIRENGNHTEERDAIPEEIPIKTEAPKIEEQEEPEKEPERPEEAQEAQDGQAEAAEEAEEPEKEEQPEETAIPEPETLKEPSPEPEAEAEMPEAEVKEEEEIPASSGIPEPEEPEKQVEVETVEVKQEEPQAAEEAEKEATPAPAIPEIEEELVKEEPEAEAVPETVPEVPEVEQTEVEEKPPAAERAEAIEEAIEDEEEATSEPTAAEEDEVEDEAEEAVDDEEEEPEEQLPKPKTKNTPKIKLGSQKKASTSAASTSRSSAKKKKEPVYVDDWDDDDEPYETSAKKKRAATSAKKKAAKKQQALIDYGEEYGDEDGIPPELLMDDKRRSGRRQTTTTKTYTEPSIHEFDEFIIPDSEGGTPTGDEDDEDLPPAVHMPAVVEKILAMRSEGGEESEEEFYVKWKGRAHMHCEWKTAAQLEEIDKRVSAKLKRYKQKRAAGIEDEELNEDYLVVERVLALDTQDDGDEYALVKWKSLPYDEVTWEPLSTVPTEKNCILADEMGLGKTVQTITFLSRVYEYGIHGPFLIVVPLSTIHNWVREFETWTDMNAVVYHGSAAGRQIIEGHEIYHEKPTGSDDKNKGLWRKGICKLDALITTFEMVVTEVEFLRKINWRVCVIDEAHRLKNRNCKLLTGGLLSLRMEHRVLLTGTPLQNNVEELFSLLNFLHPEKFGSSDEFLREFGECKTDEQVTRLQEILKPMMLRRLKEDVEKSLQPREEVIIEVRLLHPEMDEDTAQRKALVDASGKMVLIEKLLPKLKSDGHRVLIFSQMVKVLDLIEEFVSNHGYLYERIDGNVRGDLRQAAIDRFSKKDSDRFVFLLCTRAGGLGINLTAADTVIIFDSDWNPQNDLQAQARCHRIGQQKSVKVYRLITANTYEREMFDKASLKLGLDKAVLQSTTVMDKKEQLTKKEIEELLKKGAYGSIMDESSEGSKFSEEDIETILSRRATTVTLEAGVKGSTFSKASFGSSNNTEEIDIDDPNFWNKWAEKANVDLEKVRERQSGKQLIIAEPRNRKKRFEEDTLKEGEGSGSDESEMGAKGRRDRARKRRKGVEDDDDEYVRYRPDELAFNKTDYFKVEKLIGSFGWGRWKLIKEQGDVDANETELEHLARTLILHNLRDFRGDERTKEYVYAVIEPT